MFQEEEKRIAAHVLEGKGLTDYLISVFRQTFLDNLEAEVTGTKLPTDSQHPGGHDR